MSWVHGESWLDILHAGRLRFSLYRDDRGYRVLLPQDPTPLGTRCATFDEAMSVLMEAVDG